ncbi:hypothetical protein [Streptomyces viridosporus]|nr:hypothetical protein [Streptomyces viridosporus]
MTSDEMPTRGPRRPEPTPDLARLTAVRETADRIVAQVGDWDGGESPRLMVAVIDPETNTRLRTTFVTVRPEPAARHLHLVAAHEKTKDELPRRPRGPHPYPTGVAS